MPAASNITVKKNDGTTDVVYTLVQASAGDKIAALWRNLTVGTAAIHRPWYSLMSFFNGPKTARKVAVEYQYPMLATGTDGKVNVVDKFIFRAPEIIIPLGMSDADLNEAVSQCCNLIAAAATKDTLKSGFAPT